MDNEETMVIIIDNMFSGYLIFKLIILNQTVGAELIIKIFDTKDMAIDSKYQVVNRFIRYGIFH